MAKSKINPDAPQLITEFIAEMPEPQKSISLKLRALIHKAAPAVMEDWKWGPNFNYKGMLCAFAHSKHDVHFAFFQGASMKDPTGFLTEGKENKNTRYAKIAGLNDVKEKVITALIKEAVTINEQGITVKEKIVAIPDDFKKALKKAKVLEKFEQTNFTNRKEYVQWIEGAKKIETRVSRIERAVEKIGKGIKFS